MLFRSASYPGKTGPVAVNPNGVAAICGGRQTQPRWGWGLAAQFTQGSSRLATLGFEPESRWDSLNEFMLRAVEWACEAGRLATPTKSDHMILHSACFLLTCPLVVRVCSSCKT